MDKTKNVSSKEMVHNGKEDRLTTILSSVRFAFKSKSRLIVKSFHSQPQSPSQNRDRSRLGKGFVEREYKSKRNFLNLGFPLISQKFALNAS